MECPICGHTLGENDAFCPNCGNFALPLQDNDRTVPAVPTPPGTPDDGSALIDPPDEMTDDQTENPAHKVAERLYPPPGEALDGNPLAYAEDASDSAGSSQKRPVKRKTSASVEKAKKSVRRMGIITAVAGLLAVCAIAAAIYVLVSTASLRVQLNKAQKENSTAQANAAELETQVAELTESLSAATEENQSLGQQVAELQSQINSMESTVNQNQYDKDSAERQLDEASTQLEAVSQENESLQQQLTSTETELSEAQISLAEAQSALEDAQAENEELVSENGTLRSQLSSYEDEVEFYDSNVVFVHLSGSDRYYHKYACPNFTRRNFAAYTVSQAVSNGYSACPVCAGGTATPDNDTDQGGTFFDGWLGGLFG